MVNNLFDFLIDPAAAEHLIQSHNSCNLCCKNPWFNYGLQRTV